MNRPARRRSLRLLATAPFLLASLTPPAAQAQSLPPRHNRLHPWEPLAELPLLALALERLAYAVERPAGGAATRPAGDAASPPTAICPTWRLGLQGTVQALLKLQSDARLMLTHLPERFPERARRDALSHLADELAHNSNVLAVALEGLFPLLKSLPDARAIEQVREIIFVLAFAQRARGYTLSTLQVALRRWRAEPEGWQPEAMRELLRQALLAIDHCQAPLANLSRLQPALLEESAPQCTP